jgi:hypothetical protein
VAEKALEAHGQRKAQKERTKKATDARRNGKRNDPHPQDRDDHRHDTRNVVQQTRPDRTKTKTKTTTESVERVAPATSEAPPPSAPEALSPKKTASQGSEAVGRSFSALGTPLAADWVPSDELCERVKADFGMTDNDISSEVLAFHAHHAAQGTLSNRWAGTFTLWCKRWREHRDKQAPPRISLTKQPALPRFEPGEADWDKAAKLYAQTGRWPREHGPDPMSPACRCPKDILARHGINLETGERRIPPKVVA